MLLVDAQMEGREVSPDTEPEDDAEPEDVRPLPAAEGAGAAQTAAPTGATGPALVATLCTSSRFVGSPASIANA